MRTRLVRTSVGYRVGQRYIELSDPDRWECPHPECGARVRWYDGAPERHPVGGARRGAWAWCPAGQGVAKFE